jgi:hypothetical protein
VRKAHPTTTTGFLRRYQFLNAASVAGLIGSSSRPVGEAFFTPKDGDKDGIRPAAPPPLPAL